MSKSILTFTLEGNTHSVRLSDHALKRMQQRNIHQNVVLSEIVALPVQELKQYKEQNIDIAIIDDNKDIAVIVSFDHNKIEIITVIDKSDIWVKSGTQIKRI